jgi:phage repressor protein C with HTH and peptisase S24 domain
MEQNNLVFHSFSAELKPGLICGMDVKQIRKFHLAGLVDEYSGVDVADKAGTAEAYLSQILGPSGKANVGDNLARRLEAAYGLERGEMDRIDSLLESGVIAALMDDGWVVRPIRPRKSFKGKPPFTYPDGTALWPDLRIMKNGVELFVGHEGQELIELAKRHNNLIILTDGHPQVVYSHLQQQREGDFSGLPKPAVHKKIFPDELRQGELPDPSESEIEAVYGPKTDSFVIPVFDVEASMGCGALMPVHDEIVERMTVTGAWLRRNVNASSPNNLALITGYGDSMEGTFSDGDLLLVDRGVNKIKVDAVYVLSLNDELYIKRLQRRPDGSVLMISDNKKYEPYIIENGERNKFEVLGRVLLAWNSKKL